MQQVTLTFNNPEIEKLLFNLSKKNNSSINYIVSNIIENFIFLYPALQKDNKEKTTADDFLKLMENNTISLSNDNITRSWIHNNSNKNDLYR